MSSANDFDAVFADLRAILKRQAGTLAVSEDAPNRYSLEAAVGPATLKAWGGKAKRPTIPVAWSEVGKAYVSFHLMALGAMPGTMSKALAARMQGKTCFNFSSRDPELFKELEDVTSRSITAFRKAGFIG
ncbi:MAG TPA: hypothetical protein VKB50_22775 [Vicinamibacterales bacterium]|nr:hypothetical protein [Vicinamibacterales bacterium]